MAKPDIMAIITNIGDSHFRNLENQGKYMAKEKLHILDGMPEDGIFIYNIDDPILKIKFEKLDYKGKALTFGKIYKQTP